eukprot:11192844-Lingulodinium_polyedra.AAC.1
MIPQYADALLRAVLDACSRLALPASDAAHAACAVQPDGRTIQPMRRTAWCPGIGWSRQIKRPLRCTCGCLQCSL